MAKKKIPAETYFGEKKKFLQIVILKKQYSEEIAHPLPSPPLPTPTKIKWSVPKSIQKKTVEYDIKSKYPEEYSTVDKVGGEKPLASKSC